MLDWTDRHCRYFHRLLAPRARLYSEMITTGALLNGDRVQLLAFDAIEHPLALQLGGSEPVDLAICARMGEDAGYDEINLNCGCPSKRVQKGSFGACLMAEPALVADCVAAMRAAVRIPVTVKCRIGIDRDDGAQMLHRLVTEVAGAGCKVVIVHARKAWLDGLSPKENRTVPPLRYDLVHELKCAFPTLTIVLNGGLRDAQEAASHLPRLDGVMIGREAYENPWSLRAFQEALIEQPLPATSRHEVAHAMAERCARELRHGVPIRAIARHMLGLFNGLPGARSWRRHLGEGMRAQDAGPGLILDAAAGVRCLPLAA